MTRPYRKISTDDAEALATIKGVHPSEAWALCVELAARLERDPSVIYAYGQRKGWIPKRKGRRVTPEEKAKIVDMHKDGVPAERIGRELGYHRGTINRVLAKEGARVKSKREHVWVAEVVVPHIIGDPGERRCTRCGALWNWPGAKDPCTGWTADEVKP